MPTIIYNVTIKVDNNINDEWLSWMKGVHIKDVMGTGKFSDWRIQKVLGDYDPEGVTYAIQYTSPDMDTFLDYNQHHAPRLQAIHQEKYRDGFVAFRTLLEVIDQA